MSYKKPIFYQTLFFKGEVNVNISELSEDSRELGGV